MPAVILVIVGAPAVVAGVAETEFEEVPLPAELTALIKTEYEVPFVNPVTLIGDEVEVGLLVVQDDPPFVEY